MLKNTLISLLKISVVVVVVIGGMVAHADWSAPPASAPTCPGGTPGCNTPINVSTATQTKLGNLGINALSLFGGTSVAPLLFNSYAGSPVSGPNKINLYSNTNTLGFGVDASTLDYHSPNMHRWNIGGIIGAMTLVPGAASSANLNVNGSITATGDVKGATRLCIGADCRSAWPTGGTGGGSGDNLGNHIATQDLIMTSASGAHDIKQAAIIQGTTVNTSNLNVVGPTSLTGNVTINTVSGGVTESGRVLTAVNNAGLASWQEISPRITILGPFHFRRSSAGGPTTFSYRNASDASWPFCALSSQVSDGSADNSGGGCTIVREGDRSWTVVVTSPSSDTATDCSIICMKFPTDSNP